jgi:hypothetical protein
MSENSDKFGFNVVNLSGDRTHITYFTDTPGPIQVGQEGERTFFGPDIRLEDSPLGTIVTVTLQPNADAGGVDLNVLLPTVFGVTRKKPLTFQTLAIMTTSRGFVAGPGVQLTYGIVPLLAKAELAILPV